MSANDGILLRETLDGTWQAHHFVESQTWPPIKVVGQPSNGYITSASDLQTLQIRTRDAAKNTEHGFKIVWLTDDLPDLERETEIAGLPFLEELTELINKYSRENESGTPDFILARFLNRQLMLFSETVNDRAIARGETVRFKVGDPVPGTKQSTFGTLDPLVRKS